MAPRPDPVTSDWQVCKAMLGDPSDVEYSWLSREVAETLELTVFQITARLKGMHGRHLVQRNGEFWQLTGEGVHIAENPEPPKKPRIPLGERVYHTPTGGAYTPGGPRKNALEDKGVPRRSPEDGKGWRMRTVWGPKNPKTGLADIYVEVFIAPDGEEWVRAEPYETADLVCEEYMYASGLTPTRLKKRDGYTAAEKLLNQAYRHADMDFKWRTRNEG